VAVLSGIIVWVDTVTPWIDDAVSSATDIRVKELYGREANALRADAQMAREVYRKITGKPYVSSEAGTWYALPPENIFKDVTIDTYREVLRGAAIYAQREVYGAALASQNPSVRQIGERYSKRFSQLTAENASR
jgi:hypothetical protein